MTAPNHIAGGMVFTGTMLSFYNVNIFTHPLYLVVLVIGSLLPDIDTPKSVIGKAIYPLALLLNRKYGHRTFTHSLVFVIITYILLNFIIHLFSLDDVILRVFLFAILSHLILDMVTVQGVPLFYPFRRNPCVLPADPSFRLQASNNRSELVAFVIFVLLAFTMYPLFTQGFWTSYNRQFGTVSHCDRENTNSSAWILCDYSYVKNNQTFIDSAYILESNDKRLILFNRKEVFTLDTDDKTIRINYAKPRHTYTPKQVVESNFMNISQDSITNLLHGKVCSGLIQSNYNVKYIDKGITYHTNFIKFSNNYDFKIITVIDTSKNELLQKLVNVDARISKDSLNQIDKLAQYFKLTAKKQRLEEELSKGSSLDLYLKNKLQNELIDIKNKIANFDVKSYQIDLVLEAERESLLKLLSESKPLLFSGYVSYYIF